MGMSTLLGCFIVLNVCLNWKSVFGAQSSGSSFKQSNAETGVKEDCTEIWCENYSYAEVASRYRGLFLTKNEFMIHQVLFHLDRDALLYHEGVKDLQYIVGSDGDGDSCCVTRQVTMISYTLQNVYGQRRYVVHLGNSTLQRYQFISQAECNEVGTCDGICVLEDSVRTVLVYDGSSIMFDQVLVPSYCSCKRL